MNKRIIGLIIFLLILIGIGYFSIINERTKNINEAPLNYKVSATSSVASCTETQNSQIKRSQFVTSITNESKSFASSENSPCPKEIISCLLTTPGSRLSPKEVRNDIQQLKMMGRNAKSSIWSLLKSSKVSYRLFGVYLALEVLGVSDEVLSFASKDPSPFVRASASQWLFLHANFDEWEKYSKSQKINPTDLQKIFAEFDRNPPRLSSPASLDYLNLNEPLQIYLKGLVIYNAEIKASVLQEIENSDHSKIYRLSLLDVFNKAVPSDTQFLSDKGLIIQKKTLIDLSALRNLTESSLNLAKTEPYKAFEIITQCLLLSDKQNYSIDQALLDDSLSFLQEFEPITYKQALQQAEAFFAIYQHSKEIKE